MQFTEKDKSAIQRYHNAIMSELLYNAYFQSKLPTLTREYFEGFVDIEYLGVSKDSREFVKNHLNCAL